MLVFHKVRPGFTWGVNNISPKRFAILLDSLKSLGIHQISFDDGYAHLFSILPEIISAGIQPLVFVPTQWIGAQNSWDYSARFAPDPHLDTSQIRELSTLGVRFGSHGHSHKPLTELTSSGIREELTRSQAILSDITGQHITEISYPFGRTNTEVVRIARELGFESGYTMRFPKNSDHPLQRGRVPVYGFDTLQSVCLKVSTGPFGRIEQAKNSIIHGLNAGTLLLNRIRG